MKLFKEINDNPSILLLDTEITPEGYEDITTITGIGNEPQLFNVMEYNSIRKWLLSLLLLKNSNQGIAFSLCSLEEQKTICKWILMPYSIRLLFFTEEEDKMNWEELVVRTEGNPLALYQGRSLIYQKLRIAVTNYVRREAWINGNYFANLSLAQQLFRDVFVMKELFIAANDPEFGEFLRSNGRYDSTTGLKSKSYWTQELETELINIYNQY